MSRRSITIGLVVLAFAGPIGVLPTISNARERCAWMPADAAALQDFADRLGVALSLPDRLQWTAGVEGALFRFEARCDGRVGVVEVALDAVCHETWTMSGTLFVGSDPTVRSLIHGLPRASRIVGATPPGPDRLGGWIPVLARAVRWGADSFDPLHGGAQHVLLWLVALVLGASVASSNRRVWHPERFLIPLLVVVAAMPLLQRGFRDDGAVQRVSSAMTDLLSDWHHPPVSLLMLRFATWVSFEPWVLRIGPLLALVGQSVLVVVVSSRWGGRLAGVLAGLWFASEARHWMGVPDLAGWGLAGLLILSWLALLPDEPASRVVHRRGRLVALAGLMLLGLLASYALIPALLMLLVEHGLRRNLRRAWDWRDGAMALVVLAVFALGVFKLLEEAMLPRRAQGAQALLQLVGLWYERSSLARSPLMFLPFVVTVVGLPFLWRARALRLLAMMIGGTLVAFALMVGHVVVKDYYVDGLWGAGCVLAGVCTAYAFGRANSTGPASHVPNGIRWAVLGLLVVPALAFREPTGPEPPRHDLDHLVWRLAAAQDAPVYTRGPEVGRFVVFEAVRRGELPPEAMGFKSRRFPTPESVAIDVGERLGEPDLLSGGPGGRFFIVSWNGLRNPGPCTPLFPARDSPRHWVCDAGASGATEAP